MGHYSRIRGSKKKADVELILAYLPTERFKRNVVRSRLDLVGKHLVNVFIDESIMSYIKLSLFVSNYYIETYS